MDEIERLKSRCERERNARKQAEALLEEKSLKLYMANKELRLLAADLAEKEERSRSILEVVADGIVAVNDSGTIESLNHAAESIFGYQSEEIVGEGIERLFAKMPSKGPLKRFLKNGKAYKVGHPKGAIGRRRDGKTFPMEYTVGVHRYRERLRAIVSVHDITKRKKAEKELRRVSQRNKMLLDAAGEGIFGLDNEGITTFINPAAVEMLGWSAEELVGQVNHDIVHHTHLDGTPYPKEACPIYKSFKDGHIHREDKELFWRRDGSSFPVEYVSTPILEGGKLKGAVVAFQDITWRKKSEAEQNRMEIQLRYAQKLESIGQLAAGIAHEINTPAQFVNDNTHFLQDSFGELERLLKVQEQLLGKLEAGNVSPEFISEVKEISEEVDAEYLIEEIPSAIGQSLEGLERIAKIVRAMKRFSHPGTDEKTPTDINQAISDTLDVSRNEWKYCSEVVTDFDQTLPLVPCIPGEFNQVILNMVVNAAHAITDKTQESADEKGTITIATRRRGEWSEIKISDTGSGIPESIRAKVFDPFFTTKAVGKGSGQGLAITYSVVVDRHKGRIFLESEVGKGTTFTIRLPLAEEGEQVAVANSVAQAG